MSLEENPEFQVRTAAVADILVPAWSEPERRLHTHQARLLTDREVVTRQQQATTGVALWL